MAVNNTLRSEHYSTGTGSANGSMQRISQGYHKRQRSALCAQLDQRSNAHMRHTQKNMTRHLQVHGTNDSKWCMHSFNSTNVDNTALQRPSVRPQGSRRHGFPSHAVFNSTNPTCLRSPSHPISIPTSATTAACTHRLPTDSPPPSRVCPHPCDTWGHPEACMWQLKHGSLVIGITNCSTLERPDAHYSRVPEGWP
jgi:hypothetical protein